MEGGKATTVLTAYGCGAHLATPPQSSETRGFLGVAKRTLLGAISVSDAGEHEREEGSMAGRKSGELGRTTGGEDLDVTMEGAGPIQGTDVFV